MPAGESGAGDGEALSGAPGVSDATPMEPELTDRRTTRSMRSGTFSPRSSRDAMSAALHELLVEAEVATSPMLRRTKSLDELPELERRMIARRTEPDREPVPLGCAWRATVPDEAAEPDDRDDVADDAPLAAS